MRSQRMLLLLQHTRVLPRRALLFDLRAAAAAAIGDPRQREPMTAFFFQFADEIDEFLVRPTANAGIKTEHSFLLRR